MRLPQKLPGSFNFVKKAEKGMEKKHPDNLKISYFFECYIDNMRTELVHEKEVIIKQFLFTEEEIIEDLNI